MTESMVMLAQRGNLSSSLVLGDRRLQPQQGSAEPGFEDDAAMSR